jgi:hypothetical protein
MRQEKFAIASSYVPIKRRATLNCSKMAQQGNDDKPRRPFHRC